MKRTFSLFVIAVGLASAEPAGVFHENFRGPAANSLPSGWEFWTPRPAMKLKTSFQPGSFRMSGGGNPHAKGRLWRAISGFEASQWYRFSVRYSAPGVPNPANAALAVVQMPGNQNNRVLTPSKLPNGEWQSTLIMQAPKLAPGDLKLHLFAGFIPNGTVEFREVSVVHMPGYVPPSRPVHVVVIDSQPPRTGPALDSARHYAAEIDKACANAKRTDIVLLPENFNKRKVEPLSPVSLDSDYMKIVRDAARRNRVYIAGSLFEEHEGVPFNAAFLIDREGGVAGYYRKTHLTIGEMIYADIGRGEEVRLLKTDFGTIGIPICFDFHYPELPRLMALQGAELILVPFAADGRLKEENMQRGAEYSGKAFAIENRIPVVFAATLGSTVQPSLIIDQNGAVLARSNSEQHTIRGVLDLEGRSVRWSGDDFKSIHAVGRRPELYGNLSLEGKR
jgi:predicted amidohydrolase